MMLWTQIDRESFFVSKDNFTDLVISETEIHGFYYFKYKNHLIKYFVLDDRQKVQYITEVALIKSGEKFTPRIIFCIRDKSKKIIKSIDDQKEKLLKARVSFDQCHENFWKLILYIQTFSNVEIPGTSFSLIDAEQKKKLEIAEQLPPEKIKEILTRAVQENKITLSDAELSLLQGRKKAVELFMEKLTKQVCEEA